MSRQIDPHRFEFVDRAVADMLRRKSPSERLAMCFAANRTMRMRIEGHLRTHNPKWDQAQIRREVARRMSGGTA